MDKKLEKIRKQMIFPKRLVELGEKKAKQMGFNFPEFVRYLLANAVQDEIEKEEAKQNNKSNK